MKTKDILHYGGIGFFSGFCASNVSQFKALGSGAYQKELIAGTTLSVAALIMNYETGSNRIYNNYYRKDLDLSTVLIPYTIGIMTGALSNLFMFGIIDALIPIASAPAPKM